MYITLGYNIFLLTGELIELFSFKLRSEGYAERNRFFVDSTIPKAIARIY